MQPLSSLIARFPYPTRVVQRGVAIAAILTQAGIGVTGSVVRVTGSGLGCPTWPECFPGSMFPVDHPEYHDLNQWIEFGNRTLTVVLAIVAALCVLVAWRIHLDHPRPRLLALAWSMPGGVAAQAIIGGITVRTGLLWWTVAIHFLVSAVLVWLAVLLLHALHEGDKPARPRVRSTDRIMLGAIAAVLGALLAAGTAVTGAGPHGGDPDTPRLHVSIELLADVHGVLLIGYLLLLALLGLRWLRNEAATAKLWWRYAAVWGISLVQGGLGSLQYRMGVPESLVSFHVLGAVLVIAATATLWCAARDRGPVFSDRPAEQTEQKHPARAGTTR